MKEKNNGSPQFDSSSVYDLLSGGEAKWKMNWITKVIRISSFEKNESLNKMYLITLLYEFLNLK